MERTANPERIIINVAATYGRSIVSLLVGLLSTRWIIAALGLSDYGLYGVVGSIIFFINAFNAIQSETIARFYAFAIGEGLREEGENADRKLLLRMRFNTALFIHACAPLVFAAIGYPIGIYALEHWLNIPLDRMEACVWVFRLSLVSVFFSIISAPYVAFFTAYQRMAELAVWTLVKVLLLFLGAYGLMFVGGDRLIWYAGMMMAISVLISMVLIWRAKMLYRDCVIDIRSMFSWGAIREMLAFTSFKFLGGMAWGVRGHGAVFMTNIYFGPTANASLAVANQLSAQSTSFSNSMANAFTPAITTAEGAGNREEAIELALRCCRFCALLILFFGIPLIIELDNWLVIWLKDPPDFVHGVCACIVMAFLLDQMTTGHQIMISAHGKIGNWQLSDSCSYLIALPISWVFIAIGGGMTSIGYAYLISAGLVSLVRVLFARSLVGLPALRWIKEVLVPLVVVMVVAIPISIVPRQFIQPSLGRLILTGVLSSVTLLATSWWFAFDLTERRYVRKRMISAYVSVI